MLKIQRSVNGQIVFKLSGRIEAEDIEENSKIVPPISGHGLAQQNVEEIGDVHNRMRITTSAAKQGR